MGFSHLIPPRIKKKLPEDRGRLHGPAGDDVDLQRGAADYWSASHSTRLIMPGKQDIGMIMTVALGALGGLIGSWVASYFGYHNANGGTAWIPFFIGVGVAIVLITVWEAVRGRRSRRTGLLRR
jgi:uncharacterized membrane protein YeaQ/YmgE (transglycosylase-associated protein family)